MHVIITTVCQVSGICTLAILASTISVKSNRSQECKSADCQSKNKCNLSYKINMITRVSTQNDWVRFPIRYFYVYLQRYVYLKSLLRHMFACQGTKSRNFTAYASVS